MQHLMENPCAKLAGWVRRHCRLLAVCLLLLAGTALAWPFARDWYHWRAARSELERFHSEQARVHLRACLEAWPASAEVQFLACRAARRAGEFQQALKHLEACKRLLPVYTDDVILEGYLLHAASGNLPQEMEYNLLDRARKDAAQAPLILEALAEGYTRTYRVPEAGTCLDRWLALQPDHVQAIYLRGNLWRQMSRQQKAVSEFRRVLELDPERDDARSWLAAGLLHIGRFEEALTHLERLHSRRPGDFELNVRRARCHKDLGHLDQARQILASVLAAHPEHGVALRTRGELEQLAGNNAAAETSFQAAAQSLPHDYKTQWTLYKFLLQEGKKTEAKDVQRRVDRLKEAMDRLDLVRSQIAVRPNDPDLHCQIGTALLAMGQTQLAFNWLQSALTKDPTCQQAHAALADYYQLQKDDARAKYHRAQIRKQASNSP